MKNDKHRHRGDVDGDVLRGAAEISRYMFGNAQQRRQIYHLYERGLLPGFKLGNTLYARRSTIDHWLTAKEE